MSDKLHFDDFAEQVALEAGFDVDTAKDYIYTMFETVIEENEKGEWVKIRNFGSFHPVHNKTRRSINPQTGEPMTIPAHYHVNFKASGMLSQIVNAKYGHLHPEVIEEERRSAMPWIVGGAILVLILGFISYFAFSGPQEQEAEMEPTAKEMTQEPIPVEEAAPEEVVPPMIEEKAEEVEESYLPPEPTPAPKVTREATVYTVNRHDTLYDISHEVYENADFWPAIFTRNDALVNDPDLIYPETELAVPGRPDLSVDAELKAMDGSYVKAYKRYKAIGKDQKAIWLLFRGFMKVDQSLLDDPQIDEHDRAEVMDYIRRFAQ